jgi:single-strand DNA-binding protein
MNSVNTVHLIGHLGHTPQLKQTETGTPVISLSLATNERWKDANGEIHEKTQWHRLTAWGKLAELCGELLSKGSRIYTEGSIDYSSFEDDGGITRYSTEIRINTMKLLDRRQLD